MTTRISKCDRIDVDSFDGETILMNLASRQVLVLNESAGALWSALDSLDDPDDLLDLLVESMPTLDRSACENSLDELIRALAEGGFVTTSDGQTALPQPG